MRLTLLRARAASFVVLWILAACGARETPAPTLDINLISTQAAQTVAAQITQTAAALPTATVPPTNTQAIAAPASPSGLNTVTPGLPAINTPFILASPTLTLLPQATVTGALCNNSAFVADVGVQDKTVIKPGRAFVKGWLVQNTGFCSWTIGYYLRRVGGNTDFNAPPYTIQLASQIVAPGQIAEITLHMTAPKLPGLYEARYQLYSNLEIPFGTGLTASIEVKK
ncbi:MAG: hypothetical protein HFACDABA_01473 [Anaerolineales bacterium]|nr:hypothetical protein [Anaerolineales bacterium]